MMDSQVFCLLWSGPDSNNKDLGRCSGPSKQGAADFIYTLAGRCTEPVGCLHDGTSVIFQLFGAYCNVHDEPTTIIYVCIQMHA